MEIDYQSVADFLVAKGLFTEQTTSVKYLLKALKIKLEDINQVIKICYNQFQRLFCRSVFKECLSQVLQNVVKVSINQDLS